ncbi:MAG: RNA polymerase sigma factor [Saprospiraceae bacterium]
MKNNTLQQQTAKVIENQHLDFERFFMTHYKVLFSLGYRLSGDKELTKDLLQSFFLELWENRFQSQNIQYLEAYLKKAFHRKVVKALQKNKRTQEKIKNSVAITNSPSYEQLLINFQTEDAQKKQLATAINQLPTQQKEALSLRFKEGLDYEEIAASTGKSPQTIYNQIHSAIQKLRKSFRPIF